MAVTLLALPGLPEVRPGDDLAALIARAAGDDLGAGDVLALAHKVVSKAEGRIVRLGDVAPGPRALALAAEHGKDPRHVEVVLSESAQLVRASAGRLICRTRHGFVCANAGVDASNAPEPDSLVLLPEDPDGIGARPARTAARPPGRRDHRLVRPRLAPRAVRGGDRVRRARAARGLARAARRGRARVARHGHRDRRRGGGGSRISFAPRTRASRPCGCAAWSGTSRPRTARAPPRSCARWRTTCSGRPSVRCGDRETHGTAEHSHSAIRQLAPAATVRPRTTV